MSEKAMYILLYKEGLLNKEDYINISINLVFDYLVQEFNLCSKNKELLEFKNNKKIEYQYMSEEDILDLKEKNDNLLIIRDNGLTHLKPNTLTCATFGIEEGVFKVILNSDIKLKNGKLIGQIGHSICSYLYYNFISNSNENTEEFKEYMKAQKKISLKCTKEELINLKNKYNPIIYNYKKQYFINLGIIKRDDKDKKYLSVKDFKLY